MSLTKNQLNAINRHLRKENWLLNEDLIAELTDHYVSGIEDRMANGMTFEGALAYVHTEFGGRKGLLKMEEEFAASQQKNATRLFRQTMLSYFRMPKLIYTLVVTAIVSYLSVENVIWKYSDWAQEFVCVALLIQLAFIVGYSVIRGWRGYRINQHVGTFVRIFQGFSLIIWVGIRPRFFVPEPYLQELNPFLITLLVLAILLYEATVLTYLKFIFARKRTVA